MPGTQGIQRWYVEELTTQWPSPSGEPVAGFTHAQIAAIAHEAGVSVEFVRQFLQGRAQETATATAPKTAQTRQATDADYWQVTLRVKKPYPLRPLVTAVTVVTIPFLLGMEYYSVLVALSRHGAPSALLASLFWGTPLLAFLLGGLVNHKRRALLTGAAFGTGWIVSMLLIYNDGGSVWRTSPLALLVPWLICAALGATAGVLGAVTRQQAPGAVRWRRRRRTRRPPRTV